MLEQRVREYLTARLGVPDLAEHSIDAGRPESFNVLAKEIRSLGIDIDLERS